MSPAEQYRQLAAQVLAKSQSEQSMTERAEWRRLSELYLQLAAQAERGERKDLTDDPLLSDSANS